MRKVVRALSVMLALSACLAQQGLADLSIKNLRVKPTKSLGLAFPGRNTNYYHLLGSIGLGVIRVNAAWKNREPKQGTYDWPGLDTRIVELQKLGMEPFITLVSDARWGVRPETSKIANGTPKEMQWWIRFVTAVVERYDGDGRNDAPKLMRPVRYFQVANEWLSRKNPSGGWAGTGRELVNYVNASYDAVKKAYPDSVFVLGGIAAFNLDIVAVHDHYADYEVLGQGKENSPVTRMTAEQIRSAKNKLRFDRIVNERFDYVLREAHYDMADIHLYGDPERTAVRAKMVREKSGNRPLLSTECGGPSMVYESDYAPEDHFRAVFAWNLESLSSGLAFCLWFRLAETNQGSTWENRKVPLFAGRGKPKPGYFAYALLSVLLQEHTHVRKIGKGQYVMSSKDGREILVAWKKGRHYLELPRNYGPVDVVRITDAKSGSYKIDSYTSLSTIALDRLPAIIGKNLPKALFQ